MVNDKSSSNFIIIGTSVHGASHKRSGKPNQDSFKVISESGAVVLSVADGHGSDSCPFSKSGSLIAVNVFCEILSDYCRQYADDWNALRVFLCREGETAIARRIDSEWKRRVHKAHKSRSSCKNAEAMPPVAGVDSGHIWKQYGTTLLGVAITPSFVFAYQLGDGDIIFTSENDTKYIVQSERLLGTDTHSLSGIDSWKKVKTEVYPLPDMAQRFAFFLSTDGFSNSYRDECSFMQTAHDYFATIVEHGSDIVRANMRAWLGETSREGSGDDVTVMIAYNDGNTPLPGCS